MSECPDCGKTGIKRMNAHKRFCKAKVKQEVEEVGVGVPEDLKGTVPQDKLSFLKLDAEQQADRMGHAIGAWRDYDRWADAECILCKLKVAVAQNPPPGSQHVVGEAIEKQCRPRG